MSAALQFAAADTAGDVPAEVTQTFSVLYANFFFPFIAGFGLFLLAAGLAAIRHGVLPAWLGWLGIALGVISLTPLGFVGFIGSLVWSAIASALLFRRESAGGEAAKPPGEAVTADAPPRQPV